ncbi:GNAT family N-acetyltransferase [Lutimaribacter sp. EGI FJ00015]|uniref:GNAT family N-acetyltransferase n=1 Tax=Lutimaribacter degradans TaxID=2945989 RepID=A0ACC6A0G3_9RHOB|nr:GNAT family N-acetyltransferase [Lutimaribacter sp. EGI FJ00013]MCM2563496.1 GNAT family N-acetyltransferase [Lutimaribacter sp. EGI FJ00013]MCO0614676.1 GNAT family N-acetyltransferase [Lutimaribacter sp. EGI FJ00015]MCO0637346.1 GNAT family N-acetyltransferase [Lutimaribacter sp. EGI FJ00014]
MTPEALARLHAAAFTHPRPWAAREFAALLESPHVFAVGDGRAFALGRAIAGEAELLTIATDPAHRRHGLGRRTLDAFHAAACERGATTAFLEVAADNAAARALYAGAGYTQTGHRPGYYTPADGPNIDAIVMARALPDPAG